LWGWLALVLRYRKEINCLEICCCYHKIRRVNICIGIYWNIYKISHNTALLELTAYMGYTSKFTLTIQHVSAFSLGHLQVH
jgi:hypothetical protein